MFGHSGDEEVWEEMDENTLTETKFMLDDMHKSKIDMADGIFVINPGGYIGESTWSEICYESVMKCLEKGNDVEIRKSPDGNIQIFEIKKHKIT